MPKITPHPVNDLRIDLENYRTLPVTTEIEAVHALISLNPDYFWDLTRSLIASGYDGTENIIALKSGKGGVLIVREGNRRIGSLKLIHGILPSGKFEVPADIEAMLTKLPQSWKTENAEVPCNVYEEKDAEIVKRLVARTHARGETSGRLNWKAIARARYNRNELLGSEPGLDLLEAYLQSAKNISEEDREYWGGEYPLTVLDEALQRIAPRLNFSTAREVVKKALADASLQKILGKVIHDIGTDTLQTRHLRPSSWGPQYGFPEAPAPVASATAPTSVSGASSAPSSTISAAPLAAVPVAAVPVISGASGKTVRTLALGDPKSVRRELRRFVPKGKRSSKVVDLLEEAKQLKFEKTPICFCFLLRSMFEISVRDYCATYRLPTTEVKKGGTREKSLADLLVDAGAHIVSTTSDSGIKGKIRTASAEIKSPHSLLSVSVMNALVHSATATITPAHIISGFHKIFPLLVELNR